MRIVHLMILAVLVPVVAQAGDGSLDPSFGNGGIVEIPWAGGAAQANAVGLDGSGRILVGGSAVGDQGDADFAVFRLLPDGTLDTSYATDGAGFRLVDFNLDGIGGNSADEIDDLAVLADGSLVALGAAHFGYPSVFSQFALVRLDAAGALDPAFGEGGTAHFGFNTFQNSDQPTTLTIDASGRILATGWLLERINGGNTLAPRLGLAALTSGGHLDVGFINGGLLETVFWRDSSTTPPTPSNGNVPYAITTDRQGRIVVSGVVYDPIPNDAAVARFESDGFSDTGFGTSGRLLLGLASGVASAVYSTGNDKLMVAGGTAIGVGYGIYLARRNADGTPDTSFGTDGITTIASGDDVFPIPTLIARTHAGGWLVAGAFNIVGGPFGLSNGVVLARFDATGQPDPTFGDGGIVTVIPDSPSFITGRVALQPDGKLVVAGSSQSEVFSVVRILADYETVFANGFDGETRP